MSVAPTLPAGWQAHPDLSVHLLSTFDASGSSTPYGYSPNQVRGAYGLGTYSSGTLLSGGINFSGVEGDGSGQTIAIVDTYDDPNALSDLNAFSAYYGLPQFNGSGEPTFEKLSQTGTTSLPSTDPGGSYSSTGNDSWEMEESLDIEWAHSMAPMANIILFEASDDGDGLYTAVQTAADTAGVVAVSMSWSGSEFSGETSDDSYFTTPSGHLGGSATLGGTDITGGITFLAAAGDSGAYASGTRRPSARNIRTPRPTSSLSAARHFNISGDSWSSETTWGNGTSSGSGGAGGGGISDYESQPSYQIGVVNNYSTSKRTYPDISADANPNTGVPIYDSWDFGSSTPWLPGYLAARAWPHPYGPEWSPWPIKAAHRLGLGSLNGRSQTLPDLYKFAAADFHDITSGSATGPSPTYSPAAGYDLASGIGSPVANLLIPQLVGPTQLAFSQQPTTVGAGATISPAVTVSVEDSLGNVVATPTAAA